MINAEELVNNTIVRRVHVNRSLSLQQLLDDTGRKQYIDKDVLAAWTVGEGDEAEVVFFKLGRKVSNEELDKEYEARGLKSADLHSLATVNILDKRFADDHPNVTVRKDSKGNWTHASFYSWLRMQRVDGNRSDPEWYASWWFAGVRK